MEVENHKSLKDYNTFGIDAYAKKFVSIASEKELKTLLSSERKTPIFILGGGSNMLLRNNIEAFVWHINIKGIEILSENDQEVWVEAKAGENWHEFVLYCLQNNYGGVENLSLIPGNVGTAPIQNIGAYGVELKDVFTSCKAIEIDSQEEKEFNLKDCKFGYRDSIFKNEAKGKYIITSVVFKLTKNHHQLHTSYGAIQQQLLTNGVENPTIRDVSEAVIEIRQSKLPNPKELGNSGSFFKNPIITAEKFQEFRLQFPEAPFYEVSPTEFKIPAGWLIEKAGFKGKRYGDAGVHKNQALVLVNYGNATGEEIWELALTIQREVKKLFGIYIEPEVNVI
ncbi:MAG: UDP-N-acetylenolpyruvoylglucosamine reductase [Flavobacteriaceae bacterium]|nr:UDP-N-acetylenolpyruvoylglucosamine reductase [Flavobacteriaceae bacterium]|tara:strand:+ start:36043 stop:37056 length:1014 start_codon:yes stop_codon:yes gene_type:complete